MKSKLLQTTLTFLFVTGLGLSAVVAGEKSEARLKAESKISEKAATATALAKVPNGKIKSSELEEEDGKLIWTFDTTTPGTKDITEVNVDAKTGAVVAVDVEKAGDEAK